MIYIAIATLLTIAITLFVVINLYLLAKNKDNEYKKLAITSFVIFILANIFLGISLVMLYLLTVETSLFEYYLAWLRNINFSNSMDLSIMSIATLLTTLTPIWGSICCLIALVFLVLKKYRRVLLFSSLSMILITLAILIEIVYKIIQIIV